jgi:hypothetical protein
MEKRLDLGEAVSVGGAQLSVVRRHLKRGVDQKAARRSQSLAERSMISPKKLCMACFGGRKSSVSTLAERSK